MLTQRQEYREGQNSAEGIDVQEILDSLSSKDDAERGLAKKKIEELIKKSDEGEITETPEIDRVLMDIFDGIINEIKSFSEDEDCNAIIEELRETAVKINPCQREDITRLMPERIKDSGSDEDGVEESFWFDDVDGIIGYDGDYEETTPTIENIRQIAREGIERLKEMMELLNNELSDEMEEDSGPDVIKGGDMPLDLADDERQSHED